MSAMNDPGVEGDRSPGASQNALRPWLGGALVLSAAVQLVGAFLRYATVATRVPSGQAEFVPLPSSISFTFFRGLTMGGQPAFLATLGLVVVLGCVFVVRPSRVCAGLIVGFCGPAVGGAAYVLVEWTRRSARWSFGPGYFILLMGILVEAAVAASLFVALWSSRPDSGRGASRSVLTLCTAVAVGASTVFSASQLVHYQPLALFTPLTLASAVAACIAFTTASALPLLAYRVSGRAGAAIAVGVGGVMTVQLVDALLRRTEFGVQTTVGWWIDLAATVLAVVLARRLARDAKATVEASAAYA